MSSKPHRGQATDDTEAAPEPRGGEALLCPPQVAALLGDAPATVKGQSANVRLINHLTRTTMQGPAPVTSLAASRGADVRFVLRRVPHEPHPSVLDLQAQTKWGGSAACRLSKTGHPGSTISGTERGVLAGVAPPRDLRGARGNPSGEAAAASPTAVRWPSAGAEWCQAAGVAATIATPQQVSDAKAGMRGT